jgi:hypothetical protein
MLADSVNEETVRHARDGAGNVRAQPDFGRWLAEVRQAGLDPATTDPSGFR